MTRETDLLVIGAGPAGLAAAVAAKRHGTARVLVAEREENPGGVLFQCIHSGFGVHRYGEELTGPEYAELVISEALAQRVEILLRSAVIELTGDGELFSALILSESEGLVTVTARAVILSMGCRERNRGNLNIPGSRVSGIMTAGLAQRLVNCDGFLPGKEIVILGSGDIGLIMARRLSLEGAYVRGVVEMQPYPGGLARNMVQCLHDFHIPLYLSHTVSNIFGRNRIEAVEIAPIGELKEPKRDGRFILRCDTLLLSVGLIPENELSLKAGIVLDKVTRGPVVDSALMTSVPGIFACGNVLHVHDVADFVSEEGDRAGSSAARYCRGEAGPIPSCIVKPGNLVSYVLPARLSVDADTVLCLRALAPVEDVFLSIKTGETVLYRKRFRKILPGSMIRVSTDSLQPKLKETRPRTLEVFFSKEAG